MSRRHTYQKDKVMIGIITLVVSLLLISFLVPVGLDSMNETTTKTVTLIEGEQNNVTDEFTNAYAKATDIDSTNDNAVIDIVDTENDETHTVNLPTSESTTVETDLGDVDVTVESIDSDTEAEVTFEFDGDFGWSDGTRGIWGLIPVIAIIAILLVIVSLATKYTNFSLG